MSVKELKARIKKITADIEQQKEVLKKLEHSKSLVQRQLNNARDPVARLPPEISSEIFTQCLPLLAEPGAHNIPMLLLNICNTWTDIALSTPALWAAVRIVFPRPEGFRQLLRTWLQRARNRPLSVSLTNTFHQGVAPIIWRHGQQLKHLEFFCEKEDDEDSDEEDSVEEIDIFGCTSPGPLPLLETLIIRCSSELDLDDYSAYRGSQILEILRLAPNLVECVFVCANLVWHAVDDVQETLVLPSLRRLMFGEDGTIPDSDDGILTRLSIPRLEALSLSMRVISFADVLSFLKRSSPPLRQLALASRVDSNERVDQLFECLRLVPALTHFDLWWPMTRLEEIFAALAESPPHLLPNLRSLIIRLYAHATLSGFDWETLLRALTARRTQLQTVHIKYDAIPLAYISSAYSKPAPNIVAALEALVADGLEIYIGTSTRNFLSICI
ncbi:hypothetical protein B0H11DRAFT_202804 [Mycena galericulata]|nr:hypothetical protein B0H11DRAFT_202804 [Mycena galericulata]